MTVHVRAVIATLPPDHSGIDPHRRQRTIDVEADTYAQGRDQITDELEDGWRILHLRTIDADGR